MQHDAFSLAVQHSRKSAGAGEKRLHGVRTMVRPAPERLTINGEGAERLQCQEVFRVFCTRYAQPWLALDSTGSRQYILVAFRECINP